MRIEEFRGEHSSNPIESQLGALALLAAGFCAIWKLVKGQWTWQSWGLARSNSGRRLLTAGKARWQQAQAGAMPYMPYTAPYIDPRAREATGVIRP